MPGRRATPSGEAGSARTGSEMGIRGAEPYSAPPGMDGPKENGLIKVSTLRTVAEVRRLAATWQAWHNHPNSDIDFYLTIVDSRDEVIDPYVLVAQREEEPVAIMVARLENTRLNWGVGYKILFRPKVRVLRVIHGGFLGESSYDVHRAFIDELKSSLSRRDVEVVALDHLRVESNLLRDLRYLVKPWERDHFRMPNIHWAIELPDNYESYLGTLSKNTRKSIKRRSKRIRTQFGRSLVVRRVTRPDQLGELLGAMEMIASKTYQRALGVGFKNDIETRRSMELSLHWGNLSSYVLYIDGKAVAFDNASRYGDTLFLKDGGYDPDFASYGLGTYLLSKQIQSAYLSPEIRRIDFGFGGSSYKEALSNKCWHEKTVYIFAPTLRGGMLNLLRTLCNGLHHLLHLSLKRMHVFDRIRKFFRERRSTGVVRTLAFKSFLAIDWFLGPCEF